MSDTKLDSKEQPGNATVSYTSKYHFNKREHNEPLRVLSEEDWEFWKKGSSQGKYYGYRGPDMGV